MKTKQAMITNRAVMHKRISELCHFLNNNSITNYQTASDKFRIARWHMNILKKSGIIFKEGDYWKGAERLTEQRLDKFVELCRDYSRNNFSKPKYIKQCEIKFPKSTTQVTPQVIPPVAKKTKRLRKVSFIKRIKFLFTGKL